MSYLVHLRQFEGPLGLLLYLIRKEEMDIFDINVNEITKQYLDYIRMMKELDLELAGEFVAMAATLIHIKSRMLLPHYNDEGEVVETEDPRKELVQKLLEYQRYQEVAKKLYDRPLLGRDVFPRGVRADFRTDEELSEIIIEEDGLFSLISAYRRSVRKAKRMVHQVRPRVQSIAMRVMEIKHRLIVGTRVVLRDLLQIGSAAPRAQLLVTFLSMLELGRMGYVSIFQNEIYGDIYIDAIKPIERNVLERVQEFDSGDAEAVAATMISEALEDKSEMEEAAESAPHAQLALGTFDVELGITTSAADGDLGGDLAAEQILDIASDEDILAAEAELGPEEAVVAAPSEGVADAMSAPETVASETLGELALFETSLDAELNAELDAELDAAFAAEAKSDDRVAFEKPPEEPTEERTERPLAGHEQVSGTESGGESGTESGTESGSEDDFSKPEGFV